MNKRCFTLVEVLIVIGVIGIVAALTIPTLISLINDKVEKNRQEVIEDRLIQGLNQLNTIDDGMNASQYQNTEQFVRALSKYYKMSQICGANELNKCFPYEKFSYTKKNGKEGIIAINNLKTPEDFGLMSEDYLAPAGFINAQGTPFVMLLKKDCIMDTGKAIYEIPTDCIQYVYDNNGSNVPNKAGIDLAYSKGILLGFAKPDGVFDNPIGEYTKYLFPSETYNWNAAKQKCNDAGYDLPTTEQLQEVWCRYKGVNPYYSCEVTDIDTNMSKKVKCGHCVTWSSSGNYSHPGNVYFAMGCPVGDRGPSYETFIVCLAK